jgi:AcrR family transcriptional regulator
VPPAGASPEAAEAPTVGAAPRTEAQRARRERILDAATALLVERDYDRIQIRHVADAAGVALDTLYRYFPSKEHLYAQVLLSWSEAFPDASSGRGPSAGSTDEERLRATLHRAARAYERRPTFYRLVTALAAVRDPTVAGLYQRFAATFELAMRRALADTDDADARLVTEAAGALLHVRLGAWSQGRASMVDVRADLDDFVRIVFDGPRPAGAR